MTDDTNVQADTGNIVDPNLTSQDPFLSSIPEDIRAEPSLQNIKDLGSLAKGYVSAQRELGSRIRIPGPDASDEVKKDFYNKVTSIDGVVRLPDPNDQAAVDAFHMKLGRPSNTDGYKLDVPPNVELNPEIVDQFKSVALKLGLNNQQVNELVKYQLGNEAVAAQARNAEFEKSQALLKNTWGQEYDNKLTLSKEVLSHYADKYPDAVNSLIQSDAGNNPVVLLMLSELAASFKESGIVKGEGISKYGLTPEEAKDRISEIMTNPKHAYFNEYDKDHSEAVNKMYTYQQALHHGQ